METTFLDMRCKEVINVCDGRVLGHIVDAVFDVRTSRILGFIVPQSRPFFGWFKQSPDIFIPYCSICKIGEDAILVEVNNVPSSRRAKVQKNAEVLNVGANSQTQTAGRTELGNVNQGQLNPPQNQRQYSDNQVLSQGQYSDSQLQNKVQYAQNQEQYVSNQLQNQKQYANNQLQCQAQQQSLYNYGKSQETYVDLSDDWRSKMNKDDNFLN